MMRPTPRTGRMIGPYLVYSPCAFASAKTVEVVVLFDNIKDTYTHPDSLIARFFHNGEGDAVVLLRQRLGGYGNGVSSRTFKSFHFFVAALQLKTCCFGLGVKLGILADWVPNFEVADQLAHYLLLFADFLDKGLALLIHPLLQLGNWDGDLFQWPN